MFVRYRERHTRVVFFTNHELSYNYNQFTIGYFNILFVQNKSLSLQNGADGCPDAG